MQKTLNNNNSHKKCYLQNPTKNDLTVSWLINCKIYSWIEFEEDKNNCNEKSLFNKTYEVQK